MTTLGSRLARVSIIGMLVVMAALFWVDGPLSTFAQTDTTSPTVSSVAISSDTGDDGVYGIGDGIEVTVTFSENVTVTGFPQLEITIGSNTRNAVYKSTTGSKVVFSYTVVVDDSDTDGISIAADNLNLKGGAIKDLSGNPADLSYSALSAQSGHKVDGIRPTITSVYLIASSSYQDGVHTIDEYLPAGVRFSEHVYVGGYPGPQMRFNFEGTTKSADFLGAFPQCNEPICVSGFGGRYGISVDFDYQIAKGDLDLDGVAIDANSVALNGGSIRDGAGNDAVLTHSAVAEDPNYIVDGVPATVRSVAITSNPGTDNTYDVGDTVEVTVTFSESVRAPRFFSSGGVVRMPLLELNVGGVAKIARTHELSTITGTALVFSYTVQDGDDDANGISIGANKLTTYNSHGITDNYSGCCPGGNKADLHHSAVADDSGHKVATSASPRSTDATLSGLTLSGVNIGTFASDTTSYTADVANSVTETTVTPTVNDSGATYVIKLGGVTDADGTVSLAVGSNVITVVVTAEDDSTTKTYTVTVTRAAASVSAPDLDITFVYTSTSLWGYSPSFTLGINVENQGSGSSGSTTLRYYRSTGSAITSGDTEVGTDAVDGLAASGVSRETIDLTAPSTPGTYYYGACVDAVSNESDTTNNCSRGIAFIVPAETSTDATLSGLSLSDVNFGTFASGTTSYSASVANSVSQTTVTPTVNDSEATYVIKLGGVTDTDGVVSLSVGSNVLTVEVTAEDDSTTRTYTVTATRAAPPSTDATLKALSLSGLSLGTFAAGTTSYTAQVAYSVSQTTVTPTVNHAGAGYVVKLGGVADADGAISLAVGSNVITIEVTAEDTTTTQTYTVTVTRATPPSTDANLKALSLSDISLGSFKSVTTSYSASVAYSMSQTTVTPTVNDSGASYVIKLGGVQDADGVIPLSVGSNVITIEVTAEDDDTTPDIHRNCHARIALYGRHAERADAEWH